MSWDGPIDSKVKNLLKNALEHELDDMLSQYMNAYVLQQRIVLVTHQFEKNTSLSPEIKALLQNLVASSQQYLDDFNKQSLLNTLESVLKVLNEQQGYVVNLTQSAKTCSEIVQQLKPIKEELIHSVNLESLIASFVIIEKSSLLASTLPPPPPPPPKAPPPPKMAVKPVLNPVAKEQLPKVATQQELNQEILFKKLKVIEKELARSQSETVTVEDTHKLSLNLKRELVTTALERQRRRYQQRLAEVRSDPTAAQPESTSRGLVFLSMLRSEITERKDKALKVKATKPQHALKMMR